MKKLVLSLSVCLFINSCIYKGSVQSYEMTVKVVDMENKPIKGYSVKSLVGTANFNGIIPSNHVKTEATAVTDVNGVAVLTYNLDDSDSFSETATIVVSEDDLFKPVNVLSHGKSGPLKKTGTIFMDSLVPLKIRIKTNRDDVASVNIRLTNEPIAPYLTSLGKDIIKRGFMDSYFQVSTPKLDVIITAMVLSKNDVNMRIDMKLLKDSTITKVSRIYPFNYKDTVFLQEF